MKVSIAVIKLVLRTNKTLADGSHPIMLRVSFNGMRERSTGYSCTVRYWDKKSECIKKGYPNFVMINAELKKQKDEAISRRDYFIAHGEVYTPSMILEREEVRNVLTNDVCGLIARYIDEKGLESRTIEKWNIIKRSLCRFCGRTDLLINEMNEAFCRKYCKWLEDGGLCNGSVRSYMSKVVALLHYAVGLGLIDSYPLSGWKYHKTYRECKSELYIHHRAMDVMLEMFFDEVIVRDGNLWSYRDGAIEGLMDVKSKLYAHYLYVISYYLCGLAPVDVSMVKKSDIKIKEVNGKSYYFFNGRRSKTSMEYRFYIPQDIESNVLIRTMLMFSNGEYFLPTLNNFVGDIRKRVNNVYNSHSKDLVEWFKEVNAEIVRRNYVNGDTIELIDLECRYYSSRHSYIMKEVQKPNVNLLKLATVTGKSVTTIHQYVTLLNESDLI